MDIMSDRRKTHTVKAGNVVIGSGHPVIIQSMTNTVTSDVRSTVDQIRRLRGQGCEMVRVAVKTGEDAGCLGDIREEISIPLVADIHFDHELALRAIESGADKIRINPGNMRKKGLEKVISAAAAADIPIRIGVNSGSLTEMRRGVSDGATRMADKVSEYLELFHSMNFREIVISLKASDVATTVEAYRIMAGRCDHPLHVGVTAAGPLMDGVVRSSMGIGALLLEGIGDTVRVSLTADPVEEVRTARRILSAAGIRRFGHEIISCPTCGRCQVDLVPIVRELESELERDPRSGTGDVDRRFLIAIMGCEVNGPGEAEAADIGIAFGGGRAALFREGEIVKTVEARSAVRELLLMLREMEEGGQDRTR
ncbi:MAG: flavodoxin-dependent (E)-4-hydroxy-3-methylbut-2-enyl-diphosphate synthase [Candidatus Omnitrophica bacterium]|nr:flavodoxin-dependent (E)-4-hydroxy-3-methylbut-2-enyl-diphosphate synthase [Candidatus Omnitrophota bacterium]